MWMDFTRDKRIALDHFDPAGKKKKFKSDFKVINYFITKKNCLFDSQMKILYSIQCV